MSTFFRYPFSRFVTGIDESRQKSIKRDFSFNLEKLLFSFLFLLSIFESGKTTSLSTLDFREWEEIFFFLLSISKCNIEILVHF